MPTSPPCPRTGGNSTPTPEELSTLMKRANTPTPLDAQAHWLPTDPEEQLTVAFRIISAAYKAKHVSHESELRNLRQQLDEANKHISTLQKKNQQQDIELLETRNRLNSCRDENLSTTSMLRRLQARNAHLESIRKAVLSSIQDGNVEDEAMNTIVSTDFLNPLSGSMKYADMSQSGDNDTMLGYGRDTAKSIHSGSTDQPSEHTSNASTDGRNFFRSVRQRVEYERFQSFIGIVRQLNAKQLSRGECLTKAKEIFGPEHLDLIEEFSRMLAKHTAVAQPEAC